MRERKDLEALAEYVYGKNWRGMVTSGEWDILIEFAAARQLREVADILEKVMDKEHALPKPHEAVALPRRNWSEATDQEVKTKCATMLRGIFERTANLGDADLEVPPEESVT